jgi:enoyl-CoA hydratase / long-chain 3-hydroxyacyl-CoA dehydrogenase
MLCVWQVNSLGEELMKEFEELYTKFSTDSAATAAVLISGKPGCFIAGADIKVIDII